MANEKNILLSRPCMEQRAMSFKCLPWGNEMERSRVLKSEEKVPERDWSLVKGLELVPATRSTCCKCFILHTCACKVHE